VLNDAFSFKKKNRGPIRVWMGACPARFARVHRAQAREQLPNAKKRFGLLFCQKFLLLVIFRLSVNSQKRILVQALTSVLEDDT